MNKQAKELFIISTLVFVVLQVLGFIQFQNPTYYFYEGKPGTYFSFFLILFASIFSFKIFLLSKKYIWLLLSVGFFYIGLDEIIAIHEKLDWLIHQVFNIKETKITDELDDVILLLYLVIGLILIYKNKDEFKKGQFFLYMKVGVVFFIVMVLSNMVNDFFKEVESRLLSKTLEAIEELTKFLAGSSFLIAVYSIYCSYKGKISNFFDRNFPYIILTLTIIFFIAYYYIRFVK